jgi:hypothetical protein
MTKIKDWLKGKKTYIVCAVAIVTVALAWSEGNVSDGEALKAVFEAIFGITLRAGVAKVF